MDAEASPPTDRRRGGRPRKSDDERRGVYVGYRATPAELAALEARATEAGAPSVSAYMRAAVEGGPVRVTGSRVPAIAPIVGQLGRLGNLINQALREARFGTFPASVATAAEDALQALAAYLRKLAAADDPET